MEDLSKQKPMCIRLCAIGCHCRQRCHLIILTALMAVLFIFDGCYGDQIESGQRDIDTGTSQVQFKKHHQRQAVNYNYSPASHDNALLRDETIKSGNGRATATAAASHVTAHVLMNKSDRSVERNGQATANVVKTTANYRFDSKRDQHRKVHQSRNINGNAFALALAPDRHLHKGFTQQHQRQQHRNASDVRFDRGGHAARQPYDSVPSSKPKITFKLSNVPTYGRTYLSYNLVRDNVQKTERFMPSNRRPIFTTQIKQTSRNPAHKSHYRPRQRNYNCSKCRIIPGTPIRHKINTPSRGRYHGMYCSKTETQ